MLASARVILEVVAALITAGGLYDLLIPRLPLNLEVMCGESPTARKLARELLRALGACLIAIGLTTETLVITSKSPLPVRTLALVLLLVLPAELINATCMYRVGAPFYVPLALALLALFSVILLWPHHPF